jgi:hypothetical protein
LVEHRIERAGLEKEHIEAQNHHLHLQHVHDRLRLVLDIGLAVLGVALLVGLIWTIYDAASDRSIVVNAFQVPATLDSGGHTGAALASTFLDALDRLRSSNRHGGDKRALVGALDPQVQVEIPEMHISFSEFRRLLHEALGHPDPRRSCGNTQWGGADPARYGHAGQDVFGESAGAVGAHYTGGGVRVRTC